MGDLRDAQVHGVVTLGTRGGGGEGVGGLGEEHLGVRAVGQVTSLIPVLVVLLLAGQQLLDLGLVAIPEVKLEGARIDGKDVGDEALELKGVVQHSAGLDQGMQVQAGPELMAKAKLRNVAKQPA